MREEIRSFFEKEQIELFEVLPFSACSVTNVELLSCSIPQVKSVIIFAVPYFCADDGERNISFYALSKDYHIFLKGLNTRLVEFLKERMPDETFMGFGDHSPIDERSAAAAAGLGVQGDNRLLITKKYGSYVFLGEVLSSAEPEKLGASQPKDREECLHCGACKKVCPCAFEGCASGISQKKGELTEEEERLILRTGLVWGCDLCQTCCPLNAQIEKTPIPFFYEDRIEILTEEMLEGMGKKAFRARAFAWHGKAPLRRNLALYGRKKEKLER